MQRRTLKITISGVLIILFSAGQAFASEIFHWVDENGIVHFSDWAPADRDVEVSKVVVGRSNPPGYDPGEDDNSILQQASRTGDRWADIKQQRDERRREQREVAERRQVPQYPQYDYPHYYRSGYYFPPVYRPGFPQRPPFKTKIKQLKALDHLGLLDRPRPYSINSSAHHTRVNAGKSVASRLRPAHTGHRPTPYPNL